MPSDDELRGAMAAAMAGFAEVVDALSETDLDAASMCDGWTIRDVVEHIIGGDRFAAFVLDGGSLHDAIGAVMGVDHLGDDMTASLADASAGARAGFAGPLDRTVVLTIAAPGASFGNMPFRKDLNPKKLTRNTSSAKPSLGGSPALLINAS